MQKNKLTHSLWLLLLIITFLLFAALIPPFSAGPFSFKKINLIADIQTDPEPDSIAPFTAAPTDSTRDTLVVRLPAEAAPESFPCPEGITCIEDFSPTHTALQNFFQALRTTKSKPIRIAFYGDSFIEGDVLCGSFRDTLQSWYGGRGVGYVALASEVTQFRTSIQHTYSNWKTYSLVGKYPDAPPLGISGYAFVPSDQNEVEYKPGRKQVPRRFDNIRIFYKNSGNSILSYHFNDTIHHTLLMNKSDSLQQLSIPEQNLPSIKLHFSNPDSVLLYGISFETNNGVYVDNFAMRGNTGMTLSVLPPDLMKQFNSFQDYKLIMLQYGLNMVSETDSLSYMAYQAKMIKVINWLKEIFPQSSILLIGISDRAGNINGKIQTIPAIPRMRDAQREIARKTHIAFWDLYTAMGGENTMVKYAAAQPPLSAKDYTHLTFRGGHQVAKKLTDALLHERNRYDKKSILP
jgi:hypothetical protein